MDNKKLNDSELEQVNGGEAVMPVIFCGTKEEDFQVLTTGFFHANCSCGHRFPLPLIERGRQVTCPECGKVFTA